jgi:hypothetical protein
MDAEGDALKPGLRAEGSSMRGRGAVTVFIA